MVDLVGHEPRDPSLGDAIALQDLRSHCAIAVKLAGAAQKQRGQLDQHSAPIFRSGTRRT